MGKSKNATGLVKKKIDALNISGPVIAQKLDSLETYLVLIQININSKPTSTTFQVSKNKKLAAWNSLNIDI